MIKKIIGTYWRLRRFLEFDLLRMIKEFCCGLKGHIPADDIFFYQLNGFNQHIILATKHCKKCGKTIQSWRQE